MTEWYGGFGVSKCGFLTHAQGACDRCGVPGPLYRAFRNDGYRSHLWGRYCLADARELAQHHEEKRMERYRQAVSREWT